MNPLTLLFDFRGRINRAKFWLAVLVQVVFFFVVVGSTMMMSSSLGTVFDAALLAYVPLIASALAVGSKRLHDRNKSAWWLLLFFGMPMLMNVIGAFLFGIEDTSLPSQIITLVSLAIYIWALVELGCLRGSIGANRYGGDPLAPQPAPPRMVR